MFPRSRPKWMSACKQSNIFLFHQGLYLFLWYNNRLYIKSHFYLSFTLFLLSLQTLTNFFNHIFVNIFNLVFNFYLWTHQANPELKQSNSLISFFLYLGSRIQLEKITKSSENCLCKLMFSELNRAIYPAHQFSVLIRFFSISHNI